jgi:hypothetical protein
VSAPAVSTTGAPAGRRADRRVRTLRVSPPVSPVVDSVRGPPLAPPVIGASRGAEEAAMPRASGAPCAEAVVPASSVRGAPFAGVLEVPAGDGTPPT